MRSIALIGVLSTALAAPGLVAAAQAPKKAPVAAKSLPASSTPAVTGTILETMDSGGYTYMLLKTPGGEIWTAVTQAKVKKGSAATVVDAVPMENFESKTLHRKFSRILFGTLAPASSGGAKPAVSQGDMQAAMMAQHSAAASGPSDVGPIKVSKAEGGKTVAEIFAQRATLKDKPIAVRGKVVKFTPEVMGKNWIHLRDGSGSRDRKDDDITVTTTDKAAVGDVVLVRGTVKLDRDLGAGYTYTVLLEDARLSK